MMNNFILIMVILIVNVKLNLIVMIINHTDYHYDNIDTNYHYH